MKFKVSLANVLLAFKTLNLVDCILVISGDASAHFESQKSPVKNLQLISLDQSNLFYDGFPVYFTCKFSVFNANYSVLFKRTVLDTNKFLGETNHWFHTYESVHSFTANCVLFLNLKSFQMLTANFSADYQEFSNQWLKLQNGTNLLETFDVLIKIFDNQLISIGFDLFATHHRSKRSQNSPEYMAYAINQSQPQYSHRPKRSSKHDPKKTRLTVESCVHIHDSVYSQIKYFLNTHDPDYARMYVTILFSNLIHNVNHIYESISDPHMAFSIELVQIVLHAQNVNTFKYNPKNRTAYFYQTSEFIADYYAKLNQSGMCDHVFYVHGYAIGQVLGQSVVGQVCRFGQHYYTSIHIYAPFSEIIFAHELAHNLGSHHDSPHISQTYGCTYENSQLMHSDMSFGHKVRTLSKCSLKQIRLALFDSKNKVLPQYRCLITRNNPKRIPAEFMKNLPGYHYSLSDQCRLLLNNKMSYACQIYTNNCMSLGCAFNGTCVGRNAPLDGSFCAENKICLFFECVDPRFGFRVNSSQYVYPRVLFNKGRHFCYPSNKLKFTR